MAGMPGTRARTGRPQLRLSKRHTKGRTRGISPAAGPGALWGTHRRLNPRETFAYAAVGRDIDEHRAYEIAHFLVASRASAPHRHSDDIQKSQRSSRRTREDPS
jgi:hypothetical protein